MSQKILIELDKMPDGEYRAWLYSGNDEGMNTESFWATPLCKSPSEVIKTIGKIFMRMPLDVVEVAKRDGFLIPPKGTI